MTRVSHSAAIAKCLITTLFLGIVATFGTTPTTSALEISSSDFPAGSLRVIGEETQEFPLKHTSVEANITGYTAEVEVRQEYINLYENPIEAVYVFPLPHNAAVYDMKMQVGERTIEADIRKREEAKKIYEQAKQRGQRASLLEQERPNIFTQSVANILPGDNITIVIRYTETLEFEEDRYRFVFPMVVGPRYIPGEWIIDDVVSHGEWVGGVFVPSVDDADRVNPRVLEPGMRSGHDISLTLNLNTGGIPITNISSVTHETDISQSPPDAQQHEATIRIKESDSIPNKDFVVEYELSSNSPQVAFFAHKPKDDGGYFTLMIQPQTDFSVSDITPKEIFFIVDTSGSMSGDPISKSKEAMSHALKNLNPEDTFYLMKFSNMIERLSMEPLPNIPENILAGLKYIENIRAGGGTEMLPGILESLEFPHDPTKLRIVVMMGDGYIGNETQILDAIQSKLGDQTRLFSFGIGSSVNRYLLDSMGRIGRGSAYYVTLRDDSQKIVEEFYERIESPLLTDLQIDWGGMEVSELYPPLYPDLFAGQPLYVHGRYKKPKATTIEVTGRAAKIENSVGSFTEKLLGGRARVKRRENLFSIPAQFPSLEPKNEWIGRVWARNKIKDLSDKMFRGEQSTIVEEITQLGLRHRLVTKYTSFVAVEETPVTTPGETPQRVDVPVELPEGTQYEGFFGRYKTSSLQSGVSGGGVFGAVPNISSGVADSSSLAGASLMSSSYGYGYGYGIRSMSKLILILCCILAVLSLVIGFAIAGIYKFVRRNAVQKKSFRKVFYSLSVLSFVGVLLGAGNLFGVFMMAIQFSRSIRSESQGLFILFCILIAFSLFLGLGVASIHKIIRKNAVQRASYRKILYGTTIVNFSGTVVATVILFTLFAGSSNWLHTVLSQFSLYLSTYGVTAFLAILLALGFTKRLAWNSILYIIATCMALYYAWHIYAAVRIVSIAPNYFSNLGLFHQVISFKSLIPAVAYGLSLYAMYKGRNWGYVVLAVLATFALVGILLEGVWPIASIGWPLLSVGIAVILYFLRDHLRNNFVGNSKQ